MLELTNSALRDGVPDPDGLPAWPRFAAEDDVILAFRADGPTVGPDPARERLDFIERVAESGRNDRYFDSADVRIRYVDVGPRDGEPIVLIHGFTQRIETAWVDTGVVDMLDDDYRVIALDWRGHGKSDKPHDPAMYGPRVANDVIRLLDRLEIEKAHVVGYSMGGHYTFRLLADHPDRLLSAMPCSDPGVHIPDGFAAVSERTVEALMASGSIRPLVDYFASPGSLTEEQARAIVEAQRDSNDVVALRAILAGYRALDADPVKLAVSGVPCLALIGEHDPFRDGALKTAAEMTNLEVQVIGGHDHITVLQSPEFAEAVKAFFAAQQRTSDRFFDSDGVRIRYIDVGPRDGEPVVLVHGGASSIELQWGETGMIGALDDDYRVIALDCRGHGKSDKPHDTEAYGNEMVLDVVRLLDHLEIEKAHIVGYSMGGRIAYK
ncbi:MAG: alpha/beta fold hydrolase, partial [Planctomycetota bacterium]